MMSIILLGLAVDNEFCASKAQPSQPRRLKIKQRTGR